MVDVDFEFPDWPGSLERYAAEINLFLAAQIQTNRGILFDREGAHNGHPAWAPLRFRKGQILSDRGTLRKSIAPYNADGSPGPDGIVRFEGETIKVGTRLLYAGLMNDGTTKLPGGVLRPVKAKALKIPLPSGQNATPRAKALRKTAKTLTYEAADGVQREGKFIFRKWVRIPARPFDQWNATDQAEIDQALINKMAEIISRD